jgi:hypothetical protein
MANDLYDDESAPSTADNTSTDVEEKSDETEDQLALVPNQFFKKQPPKPGQRETVEIVEVYEGECSIKCVYKDEDEDEEAEEAEEEMAGPAPEAEDEMMA